MGGESGLLVGLAPKPGELGAEFPEVFNLFSAQSLAGRSADTGAGTPPDTGGDQTDAGGTGIKGHIQKREYGAKDPMA